MAGRIRYGVISTAGIARNALIPGAKKTTNSEIVCIASRDVAKAKECAQKLGIPKAYGAYEEVLRDRDVDAVIIPLPNALHCEWVIRAAQAGKHVLCEKPLAVTVAEVDRMAQAAQANRVLLMEAFMYRFHPQHEFVRKTISSGAIGQVKLLRAEFTYFLKDWETNIRANGALHGGSLMDVGCYCVNLARFLMGAEPVRVQACQRYDAKHGVDGALAGVMAFPGDRMAFVYSSMEEMGRNRCEIVGTEGRIDMPGSFGGGGRDTTVTVVAGKETKAQEFKGIDQYQAEVEHFSDCILNKKPPMLTLDDTKKNTAVLVALAQAAREGRAVGV